MSLFSFLAGPPEEERETMELIREVNTLRESCSLPNEDAEVELSISIMEDAGEPFDATLGMRIGAPVHRLIRTLLAAEPFAFHPPDEGVAAQLSLAEGAMLRESLRSARHVLRNESRFLSTWRHAVTCVMAGIYMKLPPQVFIDPDQVTGKYRGNNHFQ